MTGDVHGVPWSVALADQWFVMILRGDGRSGEVFTIHRHSRILRPVLDLHHSTTVLRSVSARNERCASDERCSSGSYNADKGCCRT